MRKTDEEIDGMPLSGYCAFEMPRKLNALVNELSIPREARIGEEAR